MKLHEFLEKIGQNASHFAGKIGVPPSTVYRWVNGESRPNIDMLMKLRDATDGSVTMEDFPNKGVRKKSTKKRGVTRRSSEARAA